MPAVTIGRMTCLVSAATLCIALAACGEGADVGEQASTTTVAAATTAGDSATTATATPTSSVETTTTAGLTPSPASMPVYWAGLAADQADLGLYPVSGGDPLWSLDVDDNATLLGASLVRVAPDNVTYVETCCEPALGMVLKVDPTGVAAEATGGFFPAPSSDGSYVASTDGTWGLVITNLIDRDASLALPTDAIALSNLAWSLDAASVAFNLHSNTRVASLAVIDPFQASSVEEATILFEGEEVQGDEGTATAWYLPVFTDKGLLVTQSQMHPPFDLISTEAGVIIDADTGAELDRVSYAPGIVVDQDADASGHFVIYVLDDGSVHWLSTDGESGILATTGYRSASW